MALHKAIISSRLHQVRYLLDSEVFMDIDVNTRDENSMTPLMLCCTLEQEKIALNIARVLLNHGAHISAGNKEGENALTLACQLRKRGMVSLFLSRASCRLNEQDVDGNTVLHLSAWTGDKPILRMVLEMYKKYGVSVDVRNNNGETPLILATKHGHIGCARLLVVHGNASLTMRDNVTFQTASEWAQRSDANIHKQYFTDLAKKVSFNDRPFRSLSAGAAEYTTDKLPELEIQDRPKSASFATSSQATSSREQQSQQLRISQCGTVTTLMNTEFEHPRNPSHKDVTRLYEIYCAQHSTSYRQAAQVVPLPTPSPVPTEDDSSAADAEIPWLPGKLIRKKSAKGGRKGTTDSQRKLNNMSSAAQTIHALTALKRKTKGLCILADLTRPRTPSSRKSRTRSDTPEATSSDGDRSPTMSPSNSQTSKQLRGALLKKVMKQRRQSQIGKVDDGSDNGESRNSRSSSGPISRPTSGESEASSSETNRKSYAKKKDTLLTAVAKLQVIQSEPECSPEPSPTTVNTQSVVRAMLPRHDSGFESGDSPPDLSFPDIVKSVAKDENITLTTKPQQQQQQEDGCRGNVAKVEKLIKQKAAKKDLLRRSLSKLRLGEQSQNPLPQGLKEGLQTKDGKTKERCNTRGDSADTSRMNSTFPLEREYTESDILRNRFTDSHQGSPRTAIDQGGVFKFPRGLDGLKKPAITQQQRPANLVELDLRIQELRDELKVMKKGSRLSTKIKDVPPSPSAISSENSRTSASQHDVTPKKVNENKHPPLSPKRSDGSDSGKDGSASRDDVTNYMNKTLDAKRQRRGTKSGLALTIDLGEFRRHYRDNAYDAKHHGKGKARRRKRFDVESTESGNSTTTEEVNIQITVEDDSGVQLIDPEIEQQEIEQEKQQKRAQRVLAWKLKHPARAPSRLRQVKKSTVYPIRINKKTSLANPTLNMYVNTETNPLTRASRMPSVGQTRKRVYSISEANRSLMPKAIRSFFRGK